MTESRAFELMSKILHTISEEEYPEIYDCIDAYIIEEAEAVCEDAIAIAEELHDLDGTKQMPQCVVDFVMEVYEDEMKEGNADAACNIGSLYYTGRGGEQSYEKALKYYTMAAEGGSRQAQENLGYCYYYGRDTEVDYEKAFHFYALGAFDGHLRSLYKIGDMYRNGYYVKKNPKEAFYIYKRCLATLTEEAIPMVGADIMMRMGDCYYEGIGTEKDYKQALMFYHRAEEMFYERLEEGDFLIRGCYNKCASRQNDVREKMQGQITDFS